MALKVLVSFLLGGVIGFERERSRRPAGLRTHMLVCAGSTCFTLAGIYGFVTPGTQRDTARIAAQVVSGVGFLGAGTIFRTESTVLGLTTAASIWLVAAIGVLVAAGMYSVAAVTALLGYITLHWVRTPQRRSRFGEPSLSEDPDDD
jgi:putative Mg2+ transporter-C (MgtC) family protein